MSFTPSVQNSWFSLLNLGCPEMYSLKNSIINSLAYYLLYKWFYYPIRVKLIIVVLETHTLLFKSQRIKWYFTWEVRFFKQNRPSVMTHFLQNNVVSIIKECWDSCGNNILYDILCPSSLDKKTILPSLLTASSFNKK